MLCFTFNSKIQ